MEWTSKWRIKINTEKTTAILFSKKKRPPKLTLRIQEKLLSWSKEVKYLGIVLDSKLTWAQHIAQATRKGQIALNSLYPLLCHKSRISLKNKLLLYKSIIQPAMLYGCELWGVAAKTHLNKIQVIQNKTLRVITNASWFIRNTVIHRDLDVKFVTTYIQEKALNLIRRSGHSENPMINALGRRRPDSTKSPWVLAAKAHERLWTN